MKKKILILMLMVLCSLTLLIPFTKKASAASLDITLQDYLLNYGDVINFKVGDSLTIVDATSNQYKYGTSATGSILNNGKNGSEYASLSVSINYPYYTFTNSGGTSFPISITNVGNNVVATFTSDFSCKIAASNNNSNALTFITCQLFNSSVGGYTEEDLQNKYDEAYKNSLLEMYTYYYNSKDLSNSIYASAYIPIETFESYDLESQKTALYNLIDAIKSQSILDNGSKFYESGYNVGYDAGKESVDITVDNQHIYDYAFDAGVKVGNQQGYDECLNDIRIEDIYSSFGPLVNATISCYVEDFISDSIIDFWFNPLGDSNFPKYVNGQYIDVRSMCIDSYFKLYGTNIDDKSEVNFIVEIDFYSPWKSSDIDLSTKGIKYITFYYDDYADYYEHDVTTHFMYDENGDPITSPTYIANHNYKPDVDFLIGDVDVSCISFKTSYSLLTSDMNIAFGQTAIGTYEDGYKAGYDKGYYISEERFTSIGYDAGYGAGYDAGYGAGYGENNFTLNNLFWTIAGLPFETMKTIWNVEFLGINLAQFLSGIFMFGVVLFVIKKVAIK